VDADSHTGPNYNLSPTLGGKLPTNVSSALANIFQTALRDDVRRGSKYGRFSILTD
jgi:hypothetical protein